MSTSIDADGQPLVAIALATYNGSHYLPEFLESLLSQTYSNFQLVVSDDNSTDATLEILISYRDKFRHTPLFLKNASPARSAVRNFARLLEAVDSRYVMFADQDDIWLPQKITHTLDAMRKSEVRFGTHTPLLVHSDLTVVDAGLRQLSASYWKYQNVDPARVKLRQLLVRNCVTGCASMLNRSLLNLVRPLPEAAIMHDHWCAITAAALGQIIPVPEPLTLYRQHQGNQIGASRWNLVFVVNRLWNLLSNGGLRAPIRAKICQARTLQQRFPSSLNVRDQRTLAALVALYSQNYFLRRITLLRHGLLDAGFFRNMLLFLVV